MPSIEVASKLADALGVTLDYLIKDGEYEQLDTITLKRLKEVENSYKMLRVNFTSLLI